MIRKCAFGQDAQASTEHERFMQSVDRFVMTVTENLCRLEKENAELSRDATFQNRKALILSELDHLDRLLASHRASNPEKLLEAMSSLAISIKSHLPQPTARQ